jgi:sigma-B regulation protein RsbU (phosphoserine phosphatase)
MTPVLIAIQIFIVICEGKELDWSFAQRKCADVSRLGHDVFERYINSMGVLTFLIADTSARGAERESLGEMLRWSFLTRAPRGIAPSDILMQVNKQFTYISRTSEEPVCASVFIGVIGTQRETINYASAGHDIALRVRVGRHDHLTPTGPAIGTTQNACYHELAVKLSPSDIIAVATDGLTEARSHLSREQTFGTAGVARVFHLHKSQRDCSPAEHVLRHCDRFCAERYYDDASLFVVGKYPAGASSSLGFGRRR